jgi:hypothetical protein
MGKPLGLGSIKLTATLHRINSKARYENLFSDNKWSTGSTEQPEELSHRLTLEKLTEDFEHDVINQIDSEDTSSHKEKPKSNLFELERIKYLLKMMEWPGQEPAKIRYMELKEFKDRPVLPDPIQGFCQTVPVAKTQVEKPIPVTNTQKAFELAHSGRNPTALPNTEKQETVTLTRLPDSKGNAKVKTIDGQEIKCIKCGSSYGIKIGDSFKAKVSRANEVALEAKFVSW